MSRGEEELAALEDDYRKRRRRDGDTALTRRLESTLHRAELGDTEDDE